MYASNDDFDETKSLYKSSNHIAHYEQVTSSNFFNTINFLIYLKDPYKICGETCAQETLSSLNNLLELNLKYSITFDFLEFEKKKAIIEILIDYFKFMYENIKDNMAKHGSIYKKNNKFYNNFYNLNKSEKNFYRLNILAKFGQIMWNWADKSPQFCFKFHELNGIRVLFEYLNDESLLLHLTSMNKIKRNNR